MFSKRINQRLQAESLQKKQAEALKNASKKPTLNRVSEEERRSRLKHASSIPEFQRLWKSLSNPEIEEAFRSLDEINWEIHTQGTRIHGNQDDYIPVTLKQTILFLDLEKRDGDFFREEAKKKKLAFQVPTHYEFASMMIQWENESFANVTVVALEEPPRHKALYVSLDEKIYSYHSGFDASRSEWYPDYVADEDEIRLVYNNLDEYLNSLAVRYVEMQKILEGSEKVPSKKHRFLGLF